ncbi:MAG: FkbM family methyltransferase [Verrucomicrobiota bacterium]|nr:FkbM family methyltransferase [Verrucomicrobiota bacterium]
MRAWAKAVAVIRFLAGDSPAKGVSPRWLLRTHTRLFKTFRNAHKIEVRKDVVSPFTCVEIDGAPFVWPMEAAVEPLMHLLAELTTPDHPHQYEYGLTQLRSDDVLLDVGCCDGGFAAKAAEVGARVIAVEPSNIMAGVIRRLFELRGLPAPHIAQCLLGAAPGVAHFQDDLRDPARSQITREPRPNSYKVSVRTLDDLAADLTVVPTFIKCDAEGADFDILKGARNFLRTHRPKVAVTVYHNRNDFADIGKYLRSLGYEVEGKGLMYVAGAFRAVMIHAAHPEARHR